MTIDICSNKKMLTTRKEHKEVDRLSDDGKLASLEPKLDRVNGTEFRKEIEDSPMLFHVKYMRPDQVHKFYASQLSAENSNNELDLRLAFDLYQDQIIQQNLADLDQKFSQEEENFKILILLLSNCTTESINYEDCRNAWYVLHILPKDPFLKYGEDVLLGEVITMAEHDKAETYSELEALTILNSWVILFDQLFEFGAIKSNYFREILQRAIGKSIASSEI